jgi:SAM-dependent methyltransferase
VTATLGRFLQQMAAVGWRVSGLELDPEAAAKARTVTADVTVGDPADAVLSPRSLDLVTAFHVVEHLPEPAIARRNMLSWLAPDGLLVGEVPNVGGWGGALFGRHWSGLDFPRYLLHFTPATMRRPVGRGGGRIVDEWHWAKPRWIIRSIRFRLAAGVAKRILEIVLEAAGPAPRGEVVRYFVRLAPGRPCAS